MEDKASEILKKYWGHDNFRGQQLEIISSVLKNQDVLGIMPTGGGKSICFQIPGLIKEGLTLVISPLIALMNDQVNNLKYKGIKAVALHSGLSYREIDIAIDNCAYGNVKFLYLSPERIKTRIFRDRVEKLKISQIVIDEAHCISQWGYDFRPAYLEISELKNKIGCPILALTATATERVVKDIKENLEFSSASKVYKSKITKENLKLISIKTEDKRRIILNEVNNDESSIIYVRSRKLCQEISLFLDKNDITNDFYHAGLNSQLRQEKQDLWLKGVNRVMVCTNAFGMGIDKSDVRKVIHFDLPDSLEAYVQEAGRAGRDLQTAQAILLYNNHDLENLKKRAQQSFPSKQEIKAVYKAISNHFQLAIGSGEDTTFPFNLREFYKKYNLPPLQVYYSLNILKRNNYIQLLEETKEQSLVKITTNKTALYNFQIKNKKYDSLIKLMLRSYGGLFDNLTKIDEQFLAKKLNSSEKEIHLKLNKLCRNEIIEYLEKSNSPKIHYISARVNESYINVSKETYSDRKKIIFSNIKKMISYAETVECKTHFISKYFGDKEEYTCDNCSSCDKRKDKEDDFSHEDGSSIIEVLEEEASTIDTIISKLDNRDEKKLIKAVKFLLDNNILVYTEGNKLRIKT